MATQKYLSGLRSASTVAGVEDRCPLCLNCAILVLSEASRSLLRCKRCHLWWLEPIPAPEELAQYFQETSPRGETAASEKFEVNRHAVLELVAEMVKGVASGGPILDVGCAVGHFLSSFFVGDSRWESHGVELAPQSASRASDRGIRMRVGTLKAAGYPSSYFNAVTILDTFYYFTDPMKEIREVKRILKAGGILAIEAPHARPRLWRTTSWFGRSLTRTSRPRLQTDHLFFYTPEAIAKVLRDCDLEIKAVVPLPANVNRGAVSAIYRGYSAVTVLLWKMAHGRILPAPRFLVLAQRRGEA